MDDEDEGLDECGEDCECEDEESIRPLKFDPILPMAATLEMFSDILGALSKWAANLNLSLCCHFRFKEEQQALHEQAAREIETLTTKE